MSQVLFTKVRSFAHQFIQVGHLLTEITICRALFSNIVIGLFRPLDSLEISLPNGLGSPRAICVRHRENMMAQLRAFEKYYPQEMARGFVGALYLCYVVSFSLVANLDREPQSREPFTEACRHFFRMSRNWPVGAVLLKGLRALALQLNMQLPEESLSYFKETHLSVQPEDVPISFVIPQQADMAELLSDDGTDTTIIGVELSKIIAKWSALSI